MLDHPNPDIAIESVVLLTELTEEDLITNFEQAKQGVDIMVKIIFMLKIRIDLERNLELPYEIT